MNSQQKLVYEFIESFELSGSKGGIDTQTIAKEFGFDRTSASRVLNGLVKHGILTKTRTRPVRYFTSLDYLMSQTQDPFRYLKDINDLENDRIIVALKGSVHYPAGLLNIQLTGEIGTGKNNYARALFQYAINIRRITSSAIFHYIDFCNLDKVKKTISLINDDLKSSNQSKGGFVYITNMSAQEHINVYPILDFFRVNLKLLNLSNILVIVDSNYEDEISQFLIKSICSINIEIPSLMEMTFKSKCILVERLFAEESRKNHLSLEVSNVNIHKLASLEYVYNILDMTNLIRKIVATSLVAHTTSQSKSINLDNFIDSLVKSAGVIDLPKIDHTGFAYFDAQGRIVKSTSLSVIDGVARTDIVVHSISDRRIVDKVSNMIRQSAFGSGHVVDIIEKNKLNFFDRILSMLKENMKIVVLSDSNFSLLGVPTIRIDSIINRSAASLQSDINSVVQNYYISDEDRYEYAILEKKNLPIILNNVDTYLQEFISEILKEMIIDSYHQKIVKKELLDAILDTLKIKGKNSQILTPTKSEIIHYKNEYKLFQSKLRRIEKKIDTVLTSDYIWNLVLVIFRKEKEKI